MKKSLTLLELIVTIVIIGIISVGGIFLFSNLIDSFKYAIYHKDLTEQAEIVLRTLSRDMRRLKNPQSIYTALPKEYKFMDKDNNIIIYSL